MLLEIEQQEPIEGSLCPRCGMVTRLVGIESHPVVPNLSILTFSCPVCASVHAHAVPAKETLHAR